MQIKINYQEIQNAVTKKFNKQIGLCYVDTATVKVVYTINMFGLSKSIGVNLKVEQIEGTDLYLSYNGSLGIELVAGSFLAFMKRLLPEKTGFIQEQGCQIVLIRLSEIEKLEKVLSLMKLEYISFDGEGVAIGIIQK